MNGPQLGALQVTAVNPCGATVSRTFSLRRITPTPPPVVAASNPSSCVQCLTAPEGSAYSWTLHTSGSQTTNDFYIDGSATDRTVCVRSRIGPGSGYARVYYNGGCGSDRLMTGLAFTIAPNCFGARLSAENLAAVAESVSPNPASDAVTVTHPAETYAVTVTDLLGKRVHRQLADNHTCQVDVGGLPDGVYILHILDSAGLIPPSRHRIVVAH